MYFYFINNQIQYKPKLVDLDKAIYVPEILLTPTNQNFQYCYLIPSEILVSDSSWKYPLIIEK